MPPRKNKKVARKSKPARKFKKTTNVSEYASLSEIRTMSVADPGFRCNRLYSLMDTSLGQFTGRAINVAQAYQHYRIKNISLKVKPTFDTYAFTVTPGQASSKPNLYYMIDKAGAVPTNVTLEGLKQMGARPFALDEKPRTISWSPSVLEVTMTQGGPALLGQGSKYSISPWLNTNSNSVNVGAWNASTVDHLGVYWYVETLLTGVDLNQPYQVEVEVQFEFKKPLVTRSIGMFPAIAAGFANTNASRDGIVDDRPGGDDTELLGH